jgi:hypothetical protein
LSYQSFCKVFTENIKKLADNQITLLTHNVNNQYFKPFLRID